MVQYVVEMGGAGMKILGTTLALLLALGTVIACVGLFSRSSFSVGNKLLPVSALQTANIRQVHLLEAEPNAPPFYDLHTDQWAIAQQLIQGIREQREEIVIPVAFPSANDEEISQLLLHQVEFAIDSVRRDAPEVFWISLGSYSIGWSGERWTGRGALTVRIGYCFTPSEVEIMKGEMEAVIESILTQAPSHPAKAAAYFHDWIIKNTIYASELMAESGEMQGNEYGFNINGVFLEGRAVCEGYSKAFKLLCDRAGIPCYTVYGVANGESHSWNHVELEGEWYLVDCTWDDPIGLNLLLDRHLFQGSQSLVDGKTVEEIYHSDYAQYPDLSPLGYGEKAF